MQQLQATAKLYELVELPHLHLSRTFTYYRLPYFWILSNYTSLTSPLFCLNILLPDTPSPPWGFHTVDLGGVTGVELLPNLRTWRLHYLTAPGTYTHTHMCTLLHLTEHAPWPEVCTYNWEDVPACSHIRPIFPYSILRLHQIFPYRSAYTECGNCVDGGKLWLRPV